MTALADTLMQKAKPRRTPPRCRLHRARTLFHGGYTDLIYVMLPIWQAEFGLCFAAVGLLRGLFAGAMAGLQIPAGLLSERWGVPLVHRLWNGLAGFGYLLAGAERRPRQMLVVALVVGGIGASVQHPLASALVARAFFRARDR